MRIIRLHLEEHISAKVIEKEYASPELCSMKALIETSITGINDVDDVMLEWRSSVTASAWYLTGMNWVQADMQNYGGSLTWGVMTYPVITKELESVCAAENQTASFFYSCRRRWIDLSVAMLCKWRK